MRSLEEDWVSDKKTVNNQSWLLVTMNQLSIDAHLLWCNREVPEQWETSLLGVAMPHVRKAHHYRCWVGQLLEAFCLNKSRIVFWATTTGDTKIVSAKDSSWIPQDLTPLTNRQELLVRLRLRWDYLCFFSTLSGETRCRWIDSWQCILVSDQGGFEGETEAEEIPNLLRSSTLVQSDGPHLSDDACANPETTGSVWPYQFNS